MKTPLEIIEERITRYRNEIEGMELNDTSFVNGKYIKHLNALIMELEAVKAEIESNGK